MKSVFVCLHGHVIANQITEEYRPMAHCPECDAGIVLQGLLVGEIIYCPDCNAELEVLSVEQPAVALAPEVEEDWGE